jgi:hypothetical protein
MNNYPQRAAIIDVLIVGKDISELRLPQWGRKMYETNFFSSKSCSYLLYVVLYLKRLVSVDIIK